MLVASIALDNPDEHPVDTLAPEAKRETTFEELETRETLRASRDAWRRWRTAGDE
jgi:hypothetical protein